MARASCCAPGRPGPRSTAFLQKSQRVPWGSTQSSPEELEACTWRGLASLGSRLLFSCVCKHLTRQKVLQS